MSNVAPRPDQQAVPNQQTAQRWRAFLVWATALTALWVFANTPRSISLGGFWVVAGLPWPFAFWDGGRLEWFRPAALAADVAVWVVMMLLAYLCAWSRERHPRQDVGGKSL